MLLFALYLSLGRRNRDIPSIWLYVVPLYAMAGLVCLVAGAPRLATVLAFPLREWLLLLALAVVPTILGHSLLNGAMKHFRGNVVSVCNVGQFVFAGVLASGRLRRAAETRVLAGSVARRRCRDGRAPRLGSDGDGERTGACRLTLLC